MFRTGDETIQNDRLGRVVGVCTTLGAATVLVGAFGPWLRSGATNRSSFELLSLVERLGFAEDGLFGWAVRLWPLVPLLVVGSVVAVWSGRRTLAAALSMCAAFYVGGVVLGVSQAPGSAFVSTGWGVIVSGVGATLLLVAGVGTLVFSRARRRG